MDLSQPILTCETIGTRGLHGLLDYFEPKRVVQYLTHSLEDQQSTYELYDWIYDKFGGGLEHHQLEELTDNIDIIQSDILRNVQSKIMRNYENEPFTFHHWVTETSALIGTPKNYSDL